MKLTRENTRTQENAPSILPCASNLPCYMLRLTLRMDVRTYGQRDFSVEISF